MGSPVMAKIMSLTAGAMVGAGWWLYINAAVVGRERGGETKEALGYSWIPGVLTTIAFVLINGLLWSDMTHEERGARVKARLLLVFAILMQLGSVIWVVYMLAEQYTSADPYTFGGVALILQIALIIVG